MIAEETVIHDSSSQAVTAKTVDYAFEILEAIQKGGYKIAAIANGDSIGSSNVIASCVLKDYFDAIVISQEIGIEKPTKEIFDAALEKLSSKAENAIMVGNRIDADVVGANKLGMKSVWFKWNYCYQETVIYGKERPNFVIKSFPELLGILGLS